MEDFVPFLLAKKLKEKGFYYKCFTTYDKDGMLGYNYVQSEKIRAISFDDCLYSNNINDNNYIDAPTISQVLKWLRKEKRIDAGAVWDNRDDKWVGYVTEMDKPDLVGRYITPSIYDSYELAVIDMIKYIIDNNLI